jgi:Leucine-rich repeat (LRR) protein
MKIFFLSLLICLSLKHARSNDISYSLQEIAEMDSIPFDDIEILNIKYNRIKKEWIPLIGKLWNLKFASVDYYKYYDQSVIVDVELYSNALSVELGKLNHLYACSYGFDTLSTLPDVFSNCKHIKYLTIGGRSLDKIPDHIASFKQLEECNINISNLNELPVSFGELGQLKRLLIDSDSLKILPKSLGNLSNLEFLYFGCHNIEVIPDIWGKLDKLDQFRFYGRSLKTIEGSMMGPSSVRVITLNKVNNLIQLVHFRH